MQWYKKHNKAQFKRFAEEIFKKESPKEGIEALKKWFEKIGAPVSLKQAGIDKKEIPAIAQNAAQTAIFWGMSDEYTQESIEAILENA